MDKRVAQSTLNSTTFRIINLVNVAVPVIFIIYISFGIILGVNSPEQLTIYMLTLVLSVAWLMHSLADIILAPREMLRTSIKYILYHLIFVVSMLAVTGFTSPIANIWIIYSVIVYIYFGKRGLYYNLALLPLLAVAHIAISGYSEEVVLQSTMRALVLLTLGVLAAALTRGAQVDQKTYDDAKSQAVIQRERVTTIINNLTDAVIGVSASDEITFSNAAALSLLNTNSSIESQDLDQTIKTYERKGVEVLLSESLKDLDQTIARDDLYTIIDGERVWLEISMSPIRTTYSKLEQVDNPGYILILRDVTEARSLDEERDEFISLVSHELRTPIAIAEGSVSNALVIVQSPKPDQKKLSDTVSEAYQQIIYLSKMINDLSTLSHAESPVPFNFEPIDIKGMLHSLYDQTRANIKKPDVKLDIHLSDLPKTILTNRLYLEEILNNLVSNALKYTQKGSVSITASRFDNGVEITVSDTGIGISKREQGKIFERFYRAEDYRTRETSGTGLGLYIASKLAKKMGAEITLKSRLNHGSTFTVKIPLENYSPDKKTG